MSIHINDLNFMPAVRCPHCGKTNHPAISGWGGQFNTRGKCCRHCQQEYTLVVYAEATTEPNISMENSSLKGKIAHLRQRTYELRNSLFNKYAEFAEEFLRVEAASKGRQN